MDPDVVLEWDLAFCHDILPKIVKSPKMKKMQYSSLAPTVSRYRPEKQMKFE